jgi:hypothetical protein
MTPLGRALVFSLKYLAEMNRLCGDLDHERGESGLAGLEAAKHVREVVRRVEHVAREQAADFLELCGVGIANHFIGLGIAKLTKKKSWAYAKRHWYWKYERFRLLDT